MTFRQNTPNHSLLPSLCFGTNQGVGLVGHPPNTLAHPTPPPSAPSTPEQGPLACWLLRDATTETALLPLLTLLQTPCPDWTEQLPGQIWNWQLGPVWLGLQTQRPSWHSWLAWQLGRQRCTV